MGVDFASSPSKSTNKGTRPSEMATVELPIKGGRVPRKRLSMRKTTEVLRLRARETRENGVEHDTGHRIKALRERVELALEKGQQLEL